MASRAGNLPPDGGEPESGQIDTAFLDSLAGYRLRRASHVMSVDFAQAVQAKTGLRSVQVSILAVIRANPGIGQSQVGRALGIQRANMVPLLSALIDQDLIHRKASAEDKRVFELFLSPQGEVKLQEAQVLIQAHENRLLSELSAEDRRILIELLARVIALGAD